MKPRFRRLRFALLAFVPVAVFFAVFGGLTWRHVQAARRNQALIAAIRRNDVPAVLSLLARGADPNARAAKEGNASVWHWLMDLVQGRRIASASGPSALEVAVHPHENIAGEENGVADPAILNALIEHGANINFSYGDGLSSDKGWTPLIKILWYTACWSPPPKRGAYIQVAHRMLDRGADANDRWGSGFAPLSLAVDVADVGLVRHLLERGASVDSVDGNDELPMEVAILNDHAAMVVYLLKHGAGRALYRLRGETPLTLAAHQGEIATVRALLQDDVDVDARDREGKTALMRVCEANYWRMQEDELLQIASMLLAHGARVDTVDTHGHDVLYHALHPEKAFANVTPINRDSQFGRDLVALLKRRRAQIEQ